YVNTKSWPWANPSVWFTARGLTLLSLFWAEAPSASSRTTVALAISNLGARCLFICLTFRRTFLFSPEVDYQKFVSGRCTSTIESAIATNVTHEHEKLTTTCIVGRSMANGIGAESSLV